MRNLTEIGGRRLPFLRWSAVRMALGMRHLTTHWQVGDGREEALAQHVVRTAREGDLDDVIRTIDAFSYERSLMMHVGDEKGEILDAAIRRAAPRRVLELGTYCGYSALRMIRAMPAGGHVYSVEFLAANADIARRIWAHAGIGDRVTVVVGSLGDGGATMAALEDEHGFAAGGVDLVFLDHDKNEYLPDLERIGARGWLRPGAIVVADNVRVPGAPQYRAHMRERGGAGWATVEHETHVEYQSLIRDLVLESEYQPG
ncbi:class I SAM-dependent methyltransferase [Svornostia abyssi]|uniref:Class I SAM-dependent methyltransferase n=1 Tax=Svornostia abyssi TaxID=2898438 RepID=A0ABY5PHW6_9ACTN|nr:class I SAM-dependent methyltransferase [Parviterribacteraceae bacterium J379]